MSDDRDPQLCPKCGRLCTYDGWGLVHENGLGIGSCKPLRIVRDEKHRTPDFALPVHRDAHDTELIAAAVARQGAQKMRDRCLEVMASRYPGGVTSAAAAVVLGKDAARQVRARFTDLKKLGLIEDSGLREPNAEGNPCIVWRFTEAGRDKMGL